METKVWEKWDGGCREPRENGAMLQRWVRAAGARHRKGAKKGVKKVREEKVTLERSGSARKKTPQEVT